MSIDTLPAGADVLKARAAEMAHHPHGRLSRSPAAGLQTAAALAARLLAARKRLTAPDGGPAPGPDALAAVAAELARVPVANAEAAFNLGMNLPWRFLEAVAPAVLAAEARLGAAEGTAAPAESLDAPGGLERMALEAELDGFIHRHEERWWETLEMLVPRVLSIEA